MTSLHHIRVRRSRRLAMPLPPKPKARPLGPPLICIWRDIPIRMRADIEKVGTWDEFLDTMAAEQADALSHHTFARFVVGQGIDAVMKLVPDHERTSVRRNFWARVRVAMDRENEGERRKFEALADIERARIAGPPSSLIARFFGRSA